MNICTTCGNMGTGTAPKGSRCCGQEVVPFTQQTLAEAKRNIRTLGVKNQKEIHVSKYKHKIGDEGTTEILELRKSGEKFAGISASGELSTFNNELCRKAAKEFDHAGGIKEDYQCWAKLITLILDGAACGVDHILKAHGGTQGDLIRQFSYDE